jgi:hypothetical protein
MPEKWSGVADMISRIRTLAANVSHPEKKRRQNSISMY